MIEHNTTSTFLFVSDYNQACKQIQLNHVAEDTLKSKELAAQSMIKHYDQLITKQSRNQPTKNQDMPNPKTHKINLNK